MAGNIKGMTIEIGGNTAPLEQALKDTNKEIKTTQNELKQVEKLLKLDPNNVTLLKQKQELLTKAIGDTTTKLDALKQAQKQLDDEVKKGNPINQQEYRKLEREIAQAESSLKQMKSQVKETNPKLEALQNGLKKVGEVGKDIAKKGLNFTIEALKVLSATAVACASALLKMGVDAGKSADNLNTLSATTGLTTKQLQKFQYASNLIDVDMNTLTGALKKTTSAMNSAKDGTGKSAEAFKKLGVQIKNADGSLRNNNDVFNDSIRALGNIANETERDALAMELFGKSATELNPLIKGGIDTLDEMGKKAEELGLILSQEALDGANKFNDQLDMIKANGQGLFAKLGNQVARDLLPFMEKLNKATENLIGRLSKALSDKGVKGFIDEIIKMFNEIDWGEVARAISNGIGTALESIGTFLQTFDWEHLGESIIEFIKNIDWARLIRGVFDVIGGIIRGAGDFLKGAFETAKEDIQKWWKEKLEEAGGNGGQALLNGTKETIINSGSFLYDNVAQPLAQGVADAVDIDTEIPNFHKLSQNLGIWWEDLKYKWQHGILYDVEVWIFDLEFKIKKFFQGIEDGWNNFWKWVGDIWTGFNNWTAGVGQAIGDFFGGIFTNVSNFFGDIGQGIKDFFTVTLPEKWNAFVKKLQQIPDKLKQIGQDFVRGLWDGISSMGGWLRKQAEQWCDSFVRSVQSFFAIESPSKVMADEVGSYLAQGIGVGFNNELTKVINSMKSKLSTATESLQTGISLGDIPQVEGNKIVSENSYVTKNYTNTIETIRQPQVVELALDGTKLARTIIQPLNNEYNRLGVKI